MNLYEHSETKKVLIEQANRICKGEITDENLIRLYARFSNEKNLKENPDYKNINFAIAFPTMLKLSNKMLTQVATSDIYKEVMEKFLSLCPDPFTFLKFGIPGTIKDFTLAKNVLEDMGFSLLQTAPSVLLLLPLVVITAKTDVSDVELLTITKNELINTVDTSKITKDKYLLFLAAMRGYTLNPFFKSIKESPIRVESKSKAYNAVKIMKNELQLSYSKQIELCDFYYHTYNSETANALYNFLKACNGYNFIQEKSEVKKTLLGLCFELKKANAQMVLEGIYQLKKKEALTLLEKKEQGQIDNNRKLSTEIECSIAYDMFTENFSQHDSTLVVFPSPFFIRKWMEDSLVKPFQVIIVVPTAEEATLWKHILQVKQEIGKNITFHTPESLMHVLNEKEVSFTKIMAFMLDYEKSPPNYPAEGTVSYNLCLSIIRSCKKADVYCLSSNNAFSIAKSFSRTFIEKNLYIERIIFLPNSIESLGPKKKNLWIGKISSSKETTFGHTSKREKSFLFVDDTPKYEFNMKNFLEVQNKGLLAYAKNPTQKKRNKKNTKAILYEFSPEITFKYTASPDSRYPDKLRLTTFYDDFNKEQIEDLKKQTTKAVLIHKEEIEFWVENLYPYSFITKGKKQGKERNIREIISDYLKKIHKDEPVSLKTLLYMHPEYEKDFSNNQIDILRDIAKSNIGKELITTISMESVEEELLTTHKTIDMKLLEVSLEKLFEFASQDHRIKANSLYGTELPQARAIINRRLANVRSALATKTFTAEQAKEFIRILKAKISEGDAPCLGLLIKFFTGLETAAIATLKKEDWKKIEYYGGHQLQIYKIPRKVPQEGQEPWELFHSSTKFRFVPCSDELDVAIKNWISCKKIKSQDYLLSGNDTIVTPKMMNATFRTIMREMKLEKIAEQIVEEISISLSDYSGDFLRENFRFTASTIAGMNTDEIAYLLGNIPQTTFGIHYCDYGNPSCQYLLRTKLNRIDYAIKKSFTSQPPKSIQCKANMSKEISNDETAFPMQMNTIVSNKKDSICNISIESNYGIKIYQTEEPL